MITGRLIATRRNVQPNRAVCAYLAPHGNFRPWLSPSLAITTGLWGAFRSHRESSLYRVRLVPRLESQLNLSHCLGSGFKDPRRVSVSLLSGQYLGSGFKDPRRVSVSLLSGQYLGSGFKDPRRVSVSLLSGQYLGTGYKDPRRVSVSLLSGQYLGTGYKDPRRVSVSLLSGWKSFIPRCHDMESK